MTTTNEVLGNRVEMSKAAYEQMVLDIEHLTNEQITTALERCRKELDIMPKPFQIFERAGVVNSKPGEELDAAAMTQWDELKIMREKHIVIDPHGVVARRPRHMIKRDANNEMIIVEEGGKRQVQGYFIDPPVFEERTEWALRQIGGDKAFAHMTEVNEPFMRRDFIAAYKVWSVASSSALTLPAPKGSLATPIKNLTEGKKL